MSTRSCSDLLAAVAALAVALCAAACQRQPDPPEVQAARAAVQRYDDRLPAAFRAQDQALLGDVATEAEADRVGAIIAGLARRREVMIARLVNLRQVNARAQSPEQVVIETVETWEYEHRPATDPERALTSQERTYEMTYQVGLHDAVWKVEHAAVRAEHARSPR